MSDCPLLDPEIVDEVIDLYFAGSHDFCYLTGEFPTGLDTTVFSYATLERCWGEAKKQSEREHVTSYVTNNPQLFRIGKHDQFRGLYHHRWVMDHEEDYTFIKKIYDKLYQADQSFGWRDVVALLEKHPELMAINGSIPRDQGVTASIENDSYC